MNPTSSDPREASAGACPVCLGAATRRFMQVDGRTYLRCAACEATFVPPAQRPAAEVERAEYELHRNDPADAGYRHFLDRLAVPLLARLAPASTGLDYGCGPGPVLADMLRAAGHAMTLYDPFFAPDPAALARTYDFVTCTEVAEHFSSGCRRPCGLPPPHGRWWRNCRRPAPSVPPPWPPRCP